MRPTDTARPDRTFLGVFFLGLLILACALPAQGQSSAGVTNVRFEVMEKDGTIVLSYNLIGSGSPLEIFKVTVAVSTNGGTTFPMTPRLMAGDVGTGVRPGLGKRIVWNVRDDVKRLQADDVVFRINAEIELPPRDSRGVGSELSVGSDKPPNWNVMNASEQTQWLASHSDCKERSGSPKPSNWNLMNASEQAQWLNPERAERPTKWNIMNASEQARWLASNCK